MRSIEQTIQGFIADMNSWELRCVERVKACIEGEMDFSDSEHTGMQEYGEIFDSYCDQRLACKRDYHYTSPPDYVAGGEPILFVTYDGHELAFVETQQTTGFQKRHLYKLVLRIDGWRLVEKKIICDDGELLQSSL